MNNENHLYNDDENKLNKSLEEFNKLKNTVFLIVESKRKRSSKKPIDIFEEVFDDKKCNKYTQDEMQKMLDYLCLEYNINYLDNKDDKYKKILLKKLLNDLKELESNSTQKYTDNLYNTQLADLTFSEAIITNQRKKWWKVYNKYYILLLKKLYELNLDSDLIRNPDDYFSTPRDIYETCKKYYNMSQDEIKDALEKLEKIKK